VEVRYEDAVKPMAQTKGFGGRFGAGLPRISDGSLPVPGSNMISKMKPAGRRLAHASDRTPAPPLIHAAPLASGRSEIRRLES